MRAPHRAAGDAPVRNIVLVGFMAAGKTTVGRRLAERLGWQFVDIDALIEKQSGTSIPDLFRDRGESGFREIERSITRPWLTQPDVVLAVGGGWAAQPGALDALPEGAFAVWLRVTPEEAVKRARNSGTRRPLLDVEDPIRAATELIRRREAFYERADLRIDVDGLEPDAVAAAIEASWRDT